MNKLVLVALVAAFAVAVQVRWGWAIGEGRPVGASGEAAGDRAGHAKNKSEARIFLPKRGAWGRGRVAARTPAQRARTVRPRHRHPNRAPTTLGRPPSNARPPRTQAAPPTAPDGTVRQWSKWATDANGNKYEWGAFVDAAGNETPWGTAPPAGESDKPAPKAKRAAAAAGEAGEASSEAGASEAGEAVAAPKAKAAGEASGESSSEAGEAGEAVATKSFAKKHGARRF